jgi:homoserine kinase
MSIVRAPATVANLGSGFDAVAVALDLWSELRVSPGEGVEVDGEDAELLPRDESNLVVRAYELLRPASGRRFELVNRIAVARGLGSSAAAIALGLLAAAADADLALDAEELLELGWPLDGHADNLAAALAGGVCATWDEDGRRRLARLATSTPLVPVVVVAPQRTATRASRSALPSEVPHADASFAAGRALLLGAGLALGDPALLAAGFEDRLHEPYRAGDGSLLEAVRAALPPGAVAATLSGSGPSVVVWSHPDEAGETAAALRRDHPGCPVLVGRVSAVGAVRTGPAAAAVTA